MSDITPGEVKGWLIGVGGDVPVPIPKTGSDGQPDGYWKPEDVVQGSLDLLLMQRQAEMMQKALTLFHSEFNKTASEDLPRV